MPKLNSPPALPSPAKHFDRKTDWSLLRAVLPDRVTVLSLLIIGVTLSASPRSSAAEQSSAIPPWLMAHVGEGAGQIAQPVLQRARILYLEKLSAGAIRNPCYFAMDATRPNDPGAGRFYVICEAQHAFQAIAAGHGGGHDLPGADYSN